MLMAATWPGTSSTFFRDNKDDEGEDDAAEEEEWCELSARSGAGNSAPVVVVVVVVVVASSTCMYPILLGAIMRAPSLARRLIPRPWCLHEWFDRLLQLRCCMDGWNGWIDE